jgi:DNA-binding protein HU-beta
MNKSELTAKIAERAGLTKKDAEESLEAVTTSIINTLAAGEKVQLIGFGTFEVRHRKERQARNPRKPGEKIMTPAAKAPVFKAGKGLKTAVNK